MFDLPPELQFNIALYLNEIETAGIVKYSPVLATDYFAITHRRIHLPFAFCCSQGDLELVKLRLKDPHIKPYKTISLALKCTVMHAHLEVVKLITQDPRFDKADPDGYLLERCIEIANARIRKQKDNSKLHFKDKLYDIRTYLESLVDYDVDYDVEYGYE